MLRRLLFASFTFVAVALVARPAGAANHNVEIKEFQFTPSSITVAVGDTVIWTHLDGTNHTVTSDQPGLFDSPLMNRGSTFRFTFNQPGTFGYHCTFHPDMQGRVVAQNVDPPARLAPPALATPGDGERLASFGPTLTWSNPPGTTQYHLQVIPFNNDGPGVDLHVGSADTSLAIPPPPAWYGLLPAMTYTWRVRASNATTFVAVDDASWGPWGERRFQAPIVGSETITPVSPGNNSFITTVNPTIRWDNARNDMFYYEFQMSRDQAFGPNTFLWSELRHGGVTNPPNSYTVPPAFSLTSGAQYFWRVRPRVQGDGVPVPWAGPWSFRVR